MEQDHLAKDQVAVEAGVWAKAEWVVIALVKALEEYASVQIAI